MPGRSANVQAHLERIAASYRAAIKRWPNSRVILRQGARTVQDSVPRSVIA